MDLNNLIELANKLQDKLANAQSDAAKVEVQAESGGGLVQVKMNGEHQITSVVIDPKAVANLKLLEDLVQAAVNQAAAQIASALKNRLDYLAKDFGVDLPGGAGFLGKTK